MDLALEDAVNLAVLLAVLEWEDVAESRAIAKHICEERIWFVVSRLLKPHLDDWK